MRLPVAMLALCAATAAPAQDGAGQLSAGAGLEFTSGDYGTSTTTEILTIPLLVRYDWQRWTFKGDLPIYHVSGGRGVIPGFGNVDRNNRRRDSSVTGFGDLTGSATHQTYYDKASELGIDLTGKIKLPTGDRDKGLSTGSTDLTFRADAYKRIDRVTPFGGLGVTSYLGGDLDLKTALVYSLGASYRLNQGDSLALGIDGRTKVADNVPETRELVASWSRVVDKMYRAQAYVLYGLANGSPDWGIGANFLRAF